MKYKVDSYFGVLRQDDLTVLQKYDEEYLTKRYSDREKVRALSELRLKVLKDFVCGGTLLDFGCGTGDFVDLCCTRGFDACGLDIADYKRNCKMMDSLVEGFDVVTFFDTLEHLINPFETIEKLKPVFLFISVPEYRFDDDFEGFLHWKHRRDGEHLWYFSRETLKSSLRKIGYRCLLLSNFEDAIRIQEPVYNPNILSAIFNRVK